VVAFGSVGSLLSAIRLLLCCGAGAGWPIPSRRGRFEMFVIMLVCTPNRPLRTDLSCVGRRERGLMGAVRRRRVGGGR